MKFYLLLILTLTLTLGQAQIKTPAASPTTTATHTVGLSEVQIEYSRPSVKDRDIFSPNGLVPHGEIWRLGANRATKISFSDDVTLNGKELKKGTYAVLATPEAAQWTFHFHEYESGSWSSYAEKTPAMSVSSKTESNPMHMETFTIVTGDHTSNSAMLEFLWDKTYVGLEMEVAVDEQVMANIDQVMSGPSANDYYQAASYYHKEGKDLNKALTWIQKANNVEDKKFWQLRREALILADLGKTKEAISTAQMSMELAQAAGNKDYVKLNKESIQSWSK